MASFSPGFALKRWEENACVIRRNPEGVATVVRKQDAIVINNIRDPRVALWQPWDFQMATIYAGFGEKDRAVEWLEKDYEQRNHGLVELKVEPMLDSLRSEPRFTNLLQRIALAP